MSLAAPSFASRRAKRIPMQARGPCPNERNVSLKRYKRGEIGLEENGLAKVAGIRF